MGIDIVIAGDILNAFGDELKDIDILIDGKLPDLQGARNVSQLGDKSFRGQTFQFERLDVEPEIFVDSQKGAFGDELEVQGFHQSFKKHRGKAFKAKREPHGFKFFFAIGSVHGRDSSGNMPFIIDIFKIVRFLG